VESRRAELGWRPPHHRPADPTSPGQQGPGERGANIERVSGKRRCRSPRHGPLHYLTQAGPNVVREPAVPRKSVFPYDGRSGMEFVDRLLICADCGSEFVFTAGEQLFFLDKQFKNDPKRCKPCKSRRSAQAASPGSGPAAAGISRTETRTECSECGISTTVPFKPTQGRPVLCRQCFKNKRTPAAAPAAETTAPAAGAAPTAPPTPAQEHPPAPAPAKMASATQAAQA
jgi:CxxC-x17-CxxC domain-containing protein